MRRTLILLSLIMLLTVPARAQEPGDLELTSHLGGFIGSVTTEGSLGFVGRASVLHVLDLPALDNRAVLPFEAETSVMTAGDNLLFVGFFGENILGIVDVTDPDAPTVASLTALGDDTDRIGSLALVGDRLVVGTLGPNARTLRILDVSDPTAPVELGSVAVPDLDVLVAGGTHAFVLGTVTLRVFDIANPAAPQEVATLNAASGSFEPPLALSGDRLYVRDTGPTGGVQILDVSDPGDPALQGTFDAAPRPRGLAVLNDRAYVNDGADLVVLDVSNAEAPAEVGRLDLGFNIRLIDVFADGTSTKVLVNGEWIVDVTDPGDLIIERMGQQPEETIALSTTGDHLYIADGAMQVWRYAIEAGGALALQSRFEVLAPFAVRTIVADEDLLITAHNDGALNLFDLSTPDTPVQRGTLTLGIVPDRLRLRDGTLFAIGTNGDGQLVMVDVRNLDAPAVLGQMTLPGQSRGLFVPPANAPNPDQIYVTFAGTTPGTGGLQVIDVTNPAAPDARSTTPTPGTPRGVAVDSTIAFVGSSTAALDGWSLDAYDVSDGSNPEHRATADSVGSSISDVAAVAGVILATFPEEGLMRSFRFVKNESTGKQGRFVPTNAFQDDDIDVKDVLKGFLRPGEIIFALTEEDPEEDPEPEEEVTVFVKSDDVGEGSRGSYSVGVTPLPKEQAQGVTFTFDADKGKLTVTGDSTANEILITTDEQGSVLIKSFTILGIGINASEIEAICIRGGGGDDTIDLGFVNDSNFPNLEEDFGVDIDGEDGNDTIFGSKREAGDFIKGGAGDDTIDGDDGDDSIFGDDGNDDINGGEGEDTIEGGPGNDGLQGGNGNDDVDGGEGNDIVRGGGDDDRVSGGEGIDLVDGGPGRDQILDVGRNRAAPKTAPADPLEAASTNEQIFLGGAGNDSLFVTASSIVQRIDGGEDIDVLVVDALGFAITETDTTIVISGHAPIVFSGVETILVEDPSPVAVEDEADVPAAFALYATYPNPFNPTTTIPYDVPRASTVTLEVYDVLGVRVARLVEAEQAPGRYQVAWRADHLASGVYFVRLVAEARPGRPFSAVQKVVLVK